MIHPLSFELHIGRVIAFFVALAFGGAAIAFLLEGRWPLALLDGALALVALRLVARTLTATDPAPTEPSGR